MNNRHRELLIVRKHLRDREHPLSSDVAEAIFRLAGNEERSLPIAITKLEIVARLIDIAHEGEEGEPDRQPIPAAKRAMTNDWFNRLSNTAVFQSGYKHYEARQEYGNFPVVPVTDYFFKVVYAEGDVVEVLEGMSDHEIMHSLPKRRGRVPVEGEDGEYLRDDSGAFAQFGELAGIIVFPRNSTALLLRAWLARRGNVAAGQIQGAVASIEHARPNTVAVEHLKEKVDGLKPTITKALPRGTRKP